jgi:hypothetical protein
MTTFNIMTLSITTLGTMLHFGIKTFSITIKKHDSRYRRHIMLMVVMLGVDMRSVTFFVINQIAIILIVVAPKT